MLFDHFPIRDPSPSDYTEPTFDYLNRSVGSDMASVRAELETYFSEWPQGKTRDALRRRFRTEFYPAFYELFVHALLLRIGCTVMPIETEPDKKTPDFAVTFPNGKEVFVEARVASGESKRHAGRARELRKLYDAVNQIPPRNFFVIIDVPDSCPVPLPISRIVRHIARTNDELDERIADFCLASLTTVSLPFKVEETEIAITAIPMDRETRGLQGIRIYGGGGTRAFWGDNPDPLAAALKAKASRYGSPAIPYIVAVNLTGTVLTPRDGVVEALYKSKNVSPFWIRQNSRVSAVLVTRASPFGTFASEISLYHCPYGKHPCFDLPWQIDQCLWKDGQLVLKKGRAAGEIFPSAMKTDAT